MFVQELVEQAMDKGMAESVGMKSLRSARSLGTMVDNFEFVSKNAMITTLKKDEELIAK